MKPNGSRTTLRVGGAVLAVLFGLAALPARADTDALARLRADLSKYSDVSMAIRDGYLSSVACIQFPDGAMGVHFVNPALIGPTIDNASPPILLYLRDPAGKLSLAGIEYLVPKMSDQQPVPELFGQRFRGPMPGHEPLMPKEAEHYDLHVWLFDHNPSGTFSIANPALQCGGAYVVGG